MPINLNQLKQQPIPDTGEALRLKQNYRQFPIDRKNECYNESWSDVRDAGLLGTNYYHETQNPPYFEQIPGSITSLFLRTSVINKLVQIDEDLKTAGLRLYFFDCYRPIEVQNYFHDVWVPNRLKQDHPDWPEEKILAEVDQYWAKGAPSSDEVDLNSPPPHSTGGACDLTICKTTGEHLFMGSMFDDVAAISNTDYFEHRAKQQQLTFSESEARMNRRLLYWVMINAGFANNPTEWWHFSWGDQMWAKLTNRPTAFYSKMPI